MKAGVAAELFGWLLQLGAPGVASLASFKDEAVDFRLAVNAA
jgi:hypothetical protein